MQNKDTKEHPPEPRGFGEHARGLAGEYAHEQGWGLNEEERTKQPPSEQQADGGKDYDYGAQDFGDTPVNTAEAQPGPETHLTDQQERTKGAS